MVPFSEPSQVASNWHSNSSDFGNTMKQETKKEGIIMDHMTFEVYQYMKSFSDENGFAPTVRHTAGQLNLKEIEIESAIRQLQQMGKLVVTEIPAKSVIELADQEGIL